MDEKGTFYNNCLFSLKYNLLKLYSKFTIPVTDSVDWLFFFVH